MKLPKKCKLRTMIQASAVVEQGSATLASETA